MNPYKLILRAFHGQLHRPPYSDRYVTVFSHPRSGTHFLEAFLGENFYSGQDLSIPTVEWGHWSNRRVNTSGNPYGKLFGSHIFPNRSLRAIDFRVAYIERDGRAVAFSIWKTPGFLHPKHRRISFSDFLRLKLDWIGTPAVRSCARMTIAEHWAYHVSGWREIAAANSNVLIQTYEDLVVDPVNSYERIRRQFFTQREQSMAVNPIATAVGLLPNAATNEAWKQVFTPEDEAFFFRCIPDSLRRRLTRLF